MGIKDRRIALEHQAREMAERIGHQMSEFATYAEDRKKATSEAYCYGCSMVAQVSVNAQPHLQITGPAPRIECREHK